MRLNLIRLCISFLLTAYFSMLSEIVDITVERQRDQLEKRNIKQHLGRTWLIRNISKKMRLTKIAKYGTFNQYYISKMELSLLSLAVLEEFIRAFSSLEKDYSKHHSMFLAFIQTIIRSFWITSKYFFKKGHFQEKIKKLLGSYKLYQRSVYSLISSTTQRGL